MHVAASADSLADRHQDRYIMMPVATISRVTSDRLYRWLMAGQMTHGLSTRQQRSTNPDRPAPTTVTAPIWAATCPLPRACPRPGRIDPRSLRRIRRPNPHSAR
jgi:hypothetical protein